MGTEVTYVPGNHDEMFRAWLPPAHDPRGFEVAGVEVRREATHVTASGQRLLVIHGDEFDGVVRYVKSAAKLGDTAYRFALVLNHWFNLMRRRLGYPYWSLSQWLKRQVKEAVKAIDRFETALSADAASARFRRRRLRPHPPRRNAHGERHPLLQQRRLGGELHRARRASRRPARAARLGGGEQALLLPRQAGPVALRRRLTRRMRILIISDAWHPQVNGVVRTLTMLQQELSRLGHTADVIGPDRFRTIGMPSYRSIQLAVAPSARLVPMIEAFRPEALHIATEGPLGWAARRWALRHRVAFTTSFHTRFPEYLRARARVPLALGYAWLRRFHGPANGTMVAAGSMRRELAGGGSATSFRGRGGRPSPFRPGRGGRLAVPPPDLPLCRPGRGGEERRPVPSSTCPARR